MMQQIARKPWAFPLATTALFVVLGLTVFGQSLRNGFVAWDDPQLIHGNPTIQHLTPQTVAHAFSSYDPELYIPLTLVSYQLDYALGGLDAFVFHRTSLVLHILTSLLVVWFVLLLRSSKWLGIICGLIFLLHPLHTEPVAWVSGRKDLVAGLFTMATLVTYLLYRRDGKQWLLWLASAFFLFALLGKVMAISVPVLLLLVDWREGRAWNRRMLAEKIPFVLLAVLFGIVAIFGKTDVLTATSTLQKMLMACKSVSFYVFQAVYPLHLSALYQQSTPISMFSLDIATGMLGMAFFVAAVAYCLQKKQRDLAFGLLFFLVGVLPTLGEFAKDIEFYFASDRYMYIPLLGLIYVVVIVGEKMAAWVHGRVGGSARTWSACAAVILLIFCSHLSYVQAAVWHDTQTLFLHVLGQYPDAVRAHTNLAIAYQQSGRLDEAMQQALEAIRLHPRAKAYTILAEVYRSQGKLAQAETAYTAAMLEEPTNARPIAGLADLHASQGKIDQAIAEYEHAVTVEPYFVGAHSNVSLLYLQKNNLPAAAAHAQKAVDIQPWLPEAQFNLGLVLQHQGKLDAAITAYRKVIALQPGKDSVDAISAIGMLLLAKGDRQGAVDTLRQAEELDPGQADVRRLHALLSD